MFMFTGLKAQAVPFSAWLHILLVLAGVGLELVASTPDSEPAGDGVSLC